MGNANQWERAAFVLLLWRGRGNPTAGRNGEGAATTLILYSNRQWAMTDNGKGRLCQWAPPISGRGPPLSCCVVQKSDKPAHFPPSYTHTHPSLPLRARAPCHTHLPLMTLLPCPTCRVSFEACKLPYHQRTVHQATVKVTYALSSERDKEVIARHSDGTFHCTLQACTYKHMIPAQMQKHAKTCTGIRLDGEAEMSEHEGDLMMEQQVDDASSTPPPAIVKKVEGGEMSRFLGKMEWTAILDGGDMSKIALLTDNRVQEGEEAAVKVVTELFEEANSVLDAAPEYVAQMLVVAQSDEQGTFAVRRLRIQEKTQASYTTPLRSLVLFLLRTRALKKQDEGVGCLARAFDGVRDEVHAFAHTPTLENLSALLMELQLEVMTDVGMTCALAVFVAAKGIIKNEQSPRWANALEISPTLSRLIFCLRISYLFHISITAANKDKWLDEFCARMSQDWAPQVGRTRALSWLVNKNVFAMAVGKTLTGKKELIWSGETVSMDGMQITMSSVRSCIKAMIPELQQRYEALALPAFPPINEQMLMDNHQDCTSGHNFVHFSKAYLKTGQCVEQALQSFYTDGSLDKTKCKEYLRLEGRFGAQLAVVVHTTSGFSHRATELCATLWTNTEAHPRDVLLVSHKSSKQVLLRAHHSKTDWRTMQNNSFRFLAPQVATVVIKYLACVRPLTDKLRQCLQDSHIVRELFLSQNGQRPLSAEDFGPLLKETLNIGGTGLGIAQWRQLVTGIATKFLSWEDADSDDEDEELWEVVQARQANHSVATRRSHYQVARTNTLVPQSAIELARIASLAVQRFFELVEPAAAKRKHGVQQPLTAFIPNKRQKEAPAGNVSMDAGEGASAGAELRTDGQGVVSLLQQAPPALYLLPTEYIRLFHKAVGAVVPMDIAFGNCLHICAVKRAHLMAVLPTGAGKTLLWLVQAMYAKQQWINANGQSRQRTITVVVLPYRALVEDMQKRCTSAGLCGKVYNGKDMPLLGCVDVVLTTIDQAVGQAFRTWYSEAGTQGGLERLVLDEVHVLITEEHFRSKLSMCNLLIHASPSTPHLLLTATAPEWLQASICSKLNIPRPTTLTARTHRPNIRYSVCLHKNKTDAESEILGLVNAAREEERGIMVICTTKFLAEDVSKILACKLYTSDTELNEGKEILNAFLSREEQVLVGTSAIGTGIHRPDVGLVICYGRPYTLIGMEQQAGRAGRDGRPASAVTIYRQAEEKRKGSTLRESEERQIATKAVDEYLQGNICRRSVLCTYLETSSGQCFQLGRDVEPCDVCLRTFVPPPPAASLAPTAISETVQEETPVLASVEETAIDHCGTASALPSPCLSQLAPSFEQRMVEAAMEHGAACSSTVVNSSGAAASRLSPSLQLYMAGQLGASISPAASPGPVQCSFNAAFTQLSPSFELGMVAAAEQVEWRMEGSTPSLVSPVCSGPDRLAEIRKVKEVLLYVSDHCGTCWAMDLDHKHAGLACPRMSATEKKVFRKSFNFVPFSCCYTCARPDDYCPRGKSCKTAPPAEMQVVFDILRGLMRRYDLKALPSKWLQLALRGNRKRYWVWEHIERACLLMHSRISTT